MLKMIVHFLLFAGCILAWSIGRGRALCPLVGDMGSRRRRDPMGGIYGRSHDAVWCKNGFRMYKVNIILQYPVCRGICFVHNHCIHKHSLSLFSLSLSLSLSSGHGLSEMALLSLPAFLAVPSMFAGGMGLAFALNRLH